MKKDLTVLELIRLFLALVIGLAVYFVTVDVGFALLPSSTGVIEFFLYLLLIEAAPAFLAILIAGIVPSWRYRTIAATLLLMLMAVFQTIYVIQSTREWWSFLYAIIGFSIGLISALAAVMIWRSLKNQHDTRTNLEPVTPVRADKMPKASPILLGLSLASIPGTYLTVFVSTFLVVGLSALLVVVLLELPQIPVFLLVAAALAPLVAVFAAFRALAAIARPSVPFQQALTLDMAGLPLTQTMIDDVCSAVSTRRPDNVLLHAEPTFFVTQGKMNTFDGLTKGRTLALGMPILPHLTAQEFKAILAHEFAHFSGRDTLYSTWVAQVYRGLGESMGQLQGNMGRAEGVTGLVMNMLVLPSYLFLVTFFEFFASIDAIISRRRELRADWIAATNYGSDAFASGLKKVVQYGGHMMDHHKELVAEDANLFAAHRSLIEEDPAVLQPYLDQALQQPEYAFASHPTLQMRIGTVPEVVPATMESQKEYQAEFVEEEVRLSDAVKDMIRQYEALYAAVVEQVEASRRARTTQEPV